MNKQDKQWLNAVADLGCIVCSHCLGIEGTPAEIHHMREGMGTGMRNDHFHVLPLCQHHHRGGYAMGYHGGPKIWVAQFGTESELHEIVLQRLKEKGVTYE